MDMKLLHSIFAAWLLLFLAGCAEPADPADSELSVSNMDELTHELEQLQERLPDNQYQILAEAIASSMMADGMRGAFSGNDFNQDAWVKANVDDRTPNQIIERYKQQERENAQRQLSRIEERIQEIEQALEERNAVQELLNSVKIEGAKYHWREQSYGRAKPVIEFTITNNSEIPIRRIFVEGIVESPGRTIPWIEESFNYEFSGGLEPGESQELSLAPNQFGSWGERATRGRDDLLLTLTLINFSGPDNERILPRLPSDPESELNNLEQQRDELLTRMEDL